MDAVKVHYNSDKPAQIQAYAFAQGTDIHLAAGQEKHLPHEAWHVVQQAQGRVKPTLQMKEGVSVNDTEVLEHEADMMGAKALATDTPLKQSPMQRQDLLKTNGLNHAVVQGRFWERTATGKLVWHIGSVKLGGLHSRQWVSAGTHTDGFGIWIDKNSPTASEKVDSDNESESGKASKSQEKQIEKEKAKQATKMQRMTDFLDEIIEAVNKKPVGSVAQGKIQGKFEQYHRNLGGAQELLSEAQMNSLTSKYESSLAKFNRMKDAQLAAKESRIAEARTAQEQKAETARLAKIETAELAKGWTVAKKAEIAVALAAPLATWFISKHKYTDFELIRDHTVDIAGLAYPPISEEDVTNIIKRIAYIRELPGILTGGHRNWTPIFANNGVIEARHDQTYQAETDIKNTSKVSGYQFSRKYRIRFVGATIYSGWELHVHWKHSKINSSSPIIEGSVYTHYTYDGIAKRTNPTSEAAVQTLASGSTRVGANGEGEFMAAAALHLA